MPCNTTKDSPLDPKRMTQALPALLRLIVAGTPSSAPSAPFALALLPIHPLAKAESLSIKTNKKDDLLVTGDCEHLALFDDFDHLTSVRGPGHANTRAGIVIPVPFGLPSFGLSMRSEVSDDFIFSSHKTQHPKHWVQSFMTTNIQRTLCFALSSSSARIHILGQKGALENITRIPS